MTGNQHSARQCVRLQSAIIGGKHLSRRLPAQQANQTNHPSDAARQKQQGEKAQNSCLIDDRPHQFQTKQCRKAGNRPSRV